MSITTWGWGAVGGVVSTTGWGGGYPVEEGGVACPPQITDSLALAPEISLSARVSKVPSITTSLDLKPALTAAEGSLRPTTNAQRLRPSVSTGGDCSGDSN